MIEFVRGTLTRIDVQSITIDVSGVGYLIFCANPFQFQSNEGETITVYTYQHVREDILRLYGFASREERELFERLIQVSGIGPKGALSILAVGQPNQVVEAIEREDETFLVKFPGVGKKTARQIILDLKGKLQEVIPLQMEATTSASSVRTEPSSREALQEAVDALKALGYGEREIKKVYSYLEKEELTTDQYVKKALQYMLSS